MPKMKFPTLLAPLLVGAAASSISLAKKPDGGDPPTPPPIAYRIVWLGDTTTGINLLGGDVTYVYDVNAFGTVVGSATDQFGHQCAFVYDHFNDPPTMVDLNSQLQLPEGWTLTYARHINDAGLIAGHLVDHNGAQRVFACDYYADPPVLHDLSLPGIGLDNLSEHGELPGKGMLVGRYANTDGRHGFVWTPGDPPLLLTGEHPGAINSRGVVLVSVETGNQTWLYQRSLVTGEESPIQDSPGPAEFFHLNHTGVVAGRLLLGWRQYPARYTNEESWIILHSEREGMSTDINHQGQICGWIEGPAKFPDTSGFVCDMNDGFWRLDDLVVFASEQEKEFWLSGQNDNKLASHIRANGLSNADLTGTGYGMVVGVKYFSDFENGHTRVGFLLVPQQTD